MPMAIDALASLSDQDLLEKIKSGDELAFGQLYNRYKSGIYNYIWRLIQHQNVAEEILQDVYLTVWQGSRKFRGQSSVKTWIFRIAYFQSISWLRKHRDSEPIEENGNYNNLEPTPEEVFMERHETARIIAALDKLSSKHRSVIELTFIQGFSYKEIAAVMKCPVGTVKSRMSYALKNLEAVLSKEKNG
jgi:RNA polymerase sigma-70 factor, ECF subfamily